MKRFLDKLRIRNSLWLSLYGTVVFTSLISYFQAYPLPEIKDRLFALIQASYLFLSMISIGYFAQISILVFFPLENSNRQNRLFRLGLFGALGYGTVSLIIFLLGSIVPGSLSAKFTILEFFFLLPIGWFIKRHPNAFKLNFEKLSLHGPISIGSFSLATIGFILTFISCFSPITYYDSLVYHLALPSWYNQIGNIQNAPFNLYSNFPQNCEMIYLFILNRFAQPEYVINLFGLFVSCLIGLSLFDWGREMGGQKQGLMALAGWWTMPAVLLLSVGGYIDISLAFFVLISIRCYLISTQETASGYWIVLCGLFSGMAFATKYTGAICIILIGASILFDYRNRPMGLLRTIANYSWGVLIPSAPWLIKNIIFIGNPVFPFFYQFFGADSVGWSQETASAYFRLLTEYGAKSNMVFALFLTPWSITNSALSFGGGFDVLGDFGWFPFVFSIPLMVVMATQEKIERKLTFFALGYFTLWFATKPVLRFLIGGLPLFILLTSRVYAKLNLSKTRLVWPLTVLLTTSFFSSNFFMYFFIQDQIQAFRVPIGAETSEAYLERRLNFYPVFKELNQSLNQESKVLLLGEQRTYHLKIPFVASNLFSSSPISMTCNLSKTIADLSEFFIRNKISHVLINENEINRLGGLDRFGFDKNGILILKNFLSRCPAKHFEERGISIYSISPEYL